MIFFPFINDDLLRIAYQIFDFLQTSNIQYFSNSSFETKLIVQNIVIISFRSTKIRKIITAEFKNTRNSSIDSSIYFSK